MMVNKFVQANNIDAIVTKHNGQTISVSRDDIAKFLLDVLAHMLGNPPVHKSVSCVTITYNDNDNITIVGDLNPEWENIKAEYIEVVFSKILYQKFITLINKI